MPKLVRCLLVVAAFALASLALGQSEDSYTARLSWVPVSLAELGLVGGEGEVTARLRRSSLEVTGTFAGLESPATIARLHHGAAPGASGPAIADLEVNGSAEGTISGEVDLDRRQRDALLAGHLYVQLYAETGVPPDDSVLRGWLFASR